MINGKISLKLGQVGSCKEGKIVTITTIITTTITTTSNQIHLANNLSPILSYYKHLNSQTLSITNLIINIVTIMLKRQLEKFSILTKHLI